MGVENVLIFLASNYDNHLLPDDLHRAIRALKRVAKTWPETLWLFSCNGRLCIMRAGADGEQVMLSSGSVDPDYELVAVNIPNSGGDW